MQQGQAINRAKSAPKFEWLQFVVHFFCFLIFFSRTVVGCSWTKFQVYAACQSEEKNAGNPLSGRSCQLVPPGGADATITKS